MDAPRDSCRYRHGFDSSCYMEPCGICQYITDNTMDIQTILLEIQISDMGYSDSDRMWILFYKTRVG